MAGPLYSSKKCPHCQQWSAWQHNPADRCEHCGQLLDPQRHASTEAREERARQKPPTLLLVELHPDDSPAMRFLKTIVRGGQLAFAAILSFFVWLATVVVG